MTHIYLENGSGEAKLPNGTLLTVEDVARKLNVSEREVYRLVASRRLNQPLRIGRACRWFPSDVSAYLELLEMERRGEVKPIRKKVEFVMKRKGQAEYQGRYRLPGQDRIVEVRLNTSDKETAKRLLSDIVRQAEEKQLEKAA